MHATVETQRVKLLYEQGLLAQSTALLNIGIFMFVARTAVPLNSLILWGLSGVVIFVLRLCLQLWFRARYLRGEKTFSPDFWENIFSIGTAASGINWAVAGTILLNGNLLIHQTFLAFLLAGTTAGATVAYSSSFKAVISFLLPAVLPFGITLSLNGGEVQHAMAILLGFYMILVTVLTVRVNSYLVDSIRLAIEKENLVNKLTISQSEIVYSQKMSALGMMAAGVAHEINTPLSAIYLHLENLTMSSTRNTLTPNEIVETTSKVTSLVTRIAKIISSLRSFSASSEQKSFKPVLLESVISETLDLCQSHFKEKGMTIFVQPVPSDAIFMGHSSQIAQSLLALLTNAYEAVQGTPAGWARIDVQLDERTILLSVTDNGRGVKPELRDKLMQPFFTTKEIGQGPGLGLTTALGILKEHGGDLTFDPNSEWTKFVMKFERLPTTVTKSA